MTEAANVKPQKNKGCFEITLEGNEINCQPKVSEDDIPKEQEDLYLLIEDAVSIIDSSTLIKNSSKKYYIEKLFDIAETGLSIETNEVYPNLANKALRQLKEEILLKESSFIKNNYMKTLGFHTVVQIGILLVVQLVVLHFTKNTISYIYAYIGALVGAWISFGARKPNLSFKELSIIESDGLAPPIRLVYIGLCAVVVMLFLRTEIAVITINKLSTKSINNSIDLQLLLGVIVGLIEYQISEKLFKSANVIMDKYE